MKLIRVAYLSTVSFGVVLWVGVPFCVSLERPWRNNQRNISCIPTGTYICKRRHSDKFGDTFEITGVPGREDVLFHIGNIDDDTHGCVVLGERFEPLSEELAVQSSGLAMEEFRRLTKGLNEFKLEIINGP